MTASLLQGTNRQIVRQNPVVRPQRQGPPGSILDCATVIDVDNLWTNYSEGFWDSAGCGSNTIIATPLCTQDGYEAPIQKQFPPPVWSHAHTFAVYRAISCNLVGFDLTLADLQVAYEASEGRAVAKAIWDIYDPLAYDVPTAGGYAMCAFGDLAEYTLEEYGGSPTFLLPAGMAVALQSDRVFNPSAGGGYNTAIGGCIAIGAGMTTALALGMVVILRTPVVAQEAISMNPATNEQFYLVERTYQVGVDCDFAAKVPVTRNCEAMP